MTTPTRRQLLPSQRSIWYLRSSTPELGDAFLVPYLFQIHGPLVLDAVRQAWDAVREQHPALSTLIDADQSGPFAVEVDRRGLDLDVRDWSDLAEAKAQLLQPLDITRGQSSRLIVWQQGHNQFRLGATFDHSIFDGWSGQLFWRDFAAHYRAVVEGSSAVPAESPDLRPAVSDSEIDAAFWSAVMAGSTPFSIPGDLVPAPHEIRPLRSDHYVTGEVTPSVVVALRELARARAATPFAVLLSAFAVLLSRYVDSGDVTVAIPSTLRDTDASQHAINNFLNTLALRLSVRDRNSFADLVDRTWDALLEALVHGRYPFAEVVKLVVKDRDGAENPLTSVMFNLQTADDAGVVELPGCCIAGVEVFNPGSSFDLNLQASERDDGGLDLYLEYAGDTWSPAAAAILLENYVHLLEEFSAHAAQPVGRPTLAATPVAASDQWEVEPLADSLDLATLVSSAAAGAPESVALRFGAVQLTYAELDAAAEHYRAAILSLVQPQERVALYLDNGIELVAIIVACLRAGVTYVPLNVADAPARSYQMVSDVAAALVIVADAAQARLSEGFDGRPADAPVITVSALTELEVIEPRPTHPVPRTGAAYVIYTSGTTGAPKGVVCTYEGVANYVAWAAKHYGDGRPGDTALVSSLAFDLAIPNLFVGLLQGRTVHILAQPLDVMSFAEDLSAGAPYAFLKLAPGHLDLLSAQLTPSQCAALTSLVISAGDKFTDRLANHWFELAGVDVASEYGPTEITIGNSAEFVQAPVAGGLVPLGRPIPGTTMYVLDHAQRLVPPGGLGEVYVGGVGVATGYFARPGLTAQQFLPDPWSSVPGARMYRTGDLARGTADGQVLFEGRRDGQVKIRGFRVEIDEITSVVAGHPSVTQAFVAVTQPYEGVSQLLAWVVLAPGAELADLESYVVSKLPAHMVPLAYTVLDHLPTTANGKIDRAELLRQVEVSADQQRAETTAELSDLESTVAEVWQSVLGPGPVDLSRSFFDVGGDSIRAVTIVGQLKARGYHVTVQDVFRQRTVADLARVLEPDPDAIGLGGPVAPFSQISLEDRVRLADDVTDAYPLSGVQLGMLIELLDSDGLNYHNVTSYRIEDTEPVDPSRFRRAVASVVAEEDMLRTSFDMHGFSTPLQLVHRQGVMEVDYHDLSDCSPDVGRNKLHDILAAERARDFPLADYPLFRISLQQFDDHWRLSFGEFHPIIEGWSLHVMLMRIINRYRGNEISAGPSRTVFPTTRPRFADFIHLDGIESRSNAVIGYWSELLADATALIVPGSDRTDAESDVSYVYYADLAPQLRRLATACDVPFKSVVHAAHLLAMAKIGWPAGTGRPYSGLVCDTRPEIEGFDSVVGNYLNTVPFLIPDYESRDQFIKAVFAAEIELWPHRRVSIGYLARTRAERVPMPVAFAYLNFHVMDDAVFNLAEGIDDSPNEFGLMVTSQGDSDLNLIGRLDASSRRRLEVEYRACLEALTGPPEALAGWFGGSARPVDETPPSTLLTAADLWDRLREAWLARADEPALIMDEGQVTAHELLARTAVLARRLQQQARRRSEQPVVAVALARGPALVIAQLAVVLSGACLMLIDPDTTPARTVEQVEHVRPDLLLVDQDAQPQPWWTAESVLVLQPGGWPGDEPDPASSVGPDWLAEIGFADQAQGAAFIVFTSGTTGTPKGALNSLPGLLNELEHMLRHYPLTRSDRALYKAPVTFDVSLNELFWPLLSGTPLVVARPGGHLDAQYLIDLMRTAAITCAHVVPSVLDTLLRVDDRRDSFATLRIVISSGEALSPTLVQSFAQRAASAELVNMYGPAETAIHVTHAVVQPGTEVSIGNPIDHVVVRVVDDHGRSVRPGTVGQLAIGERAVGYGYVGQAGLTALAFRPAPDGPPGSRLYFTGDLGRMRPDGSFVYLGRSDRQVKVSGVRIELEELEQALQTLPGVSRAVVLAEAGTGTGAHLSAFIVRSAEPAPRADELRRHLLTTLPVTHVPSRFVMLDRLPLTPNGKIDARALLALRPAPATSVRPVEPSAPADPRIRFIQATWREVLGIADVGLQDNFFDRGGQSLDAMYVAARIATRFGVRMRVADVLDAPTVAAQFQLIVQGATPTGSMTTLQPGPAERTVLLAPPIGGNAVRYGPLAESLADRGFGVIAARPSADSAGPHTLAELADAYVTSWLASGLSRPWRLGGWSFGGALAYEMGVSLIERGESVDALYLIDPAYATPGGQLARDAAQIEELFVRHSQLDAADAAVLRQVGGATYEAELREFTANLTFLDDWRPRSLDRSRVGRVVLVQSSDDVGPRRDFWRSRLGTELRSMQLAVGHFDIITQPEARTAVAELCAADEAWTVYS